MAVQVIMLRPNGSARRKPSRGWGPAGGGAPINGRGPMAMRIGIIGAGAIGSVVGGMLTKAGHDVTLIDQWPEHIETMRKNGLRLSGTCGDHTIPVKALHIYEAQAISEPFDAVFISVKSYDTEWATSLGIQYLKK